MSNPLQRLNNNLKLECVLRGNNILFYSEVRKFEDWMADKIKNIHTHNETAMNIARDKVRETFRQ
jgi:hypothetical protein